jgi:adenylate cyclase
LFVVARNSSFTYKGKAVDVRQVARDLGVHYVLEGSVRRSGDAVRIAGQLIDAATGGHVWADRFDGTMRDIFELQDDVTARVVAALAPSVRDAEIDRARRKPTDNLTAYDQYLRAWYFMHRGGRADSDEALALVRAALDADPRFALAAALGGMIGWANREDSRSAAMFLIDIAQDRAQEDSEVCLMVAHVLSVFGGEPDRVERLYRRSLEMNPNSAWALTMWATYCVRSRRCDEAVVSVERARRLSPREPYRYLHEVILGVAFGLQGHHNESITHLKRAVQDEPSFATAWAFLSAVHAHHDQMEEAHEALAGFMKLKPDGTLRSISPEMREFYPDRTAADFVIDGLRKAGLPE